MRWGSSWRCNRSSRNNHEPDRPQADRGLAALPPVPVALGLPSLVAAQLPARGLCRAVHLETMEAGMTAREKHTVHLPDGGKVVIDGDEVTVHLAEPIKVRRSHWIRYFSPAEE